MVDMAGNYTAYMTDMTRVFSVGRLTEEAYRAHQVALTYSRRWKTLPDREPLVRIYII